MNVETVRVELLGSSFVIQTDESKEYVDSLVAYLSSKVDAVRASSQVRDPQKLLILAGMFLADEVQKAKPRSTESLLDMGALADKLIAVIDTTLEG